MNQINYTEISQILKALGHPIRLKMVEILMDDECCVTDVTNFLGLSQSTVSQHLSVLKNSGIVYPKKYGTKTCYIVNNDLSVLIINTIKGNKYAKDINYHQ